MASKKPVRPAPAAKRPARATPAKRPATVPPPTVTTGPLADRTGRVLVPERLGTLRRAVDRAMAPVRARRAAWEAICAARAAGRDGEADVLLSEVLGTAPAIRRAPVAVVAPADVPDAVAALLKRLAAKPPKAEGCKIRAELRKLGHKGGLKSMGG